MWKLHEDSQALLESLMSTYMQFLRSWEKNPKMKNVNWIGGTESILTEDIIWRMKNHLDLRDWSTHTYILGEVKEEEAIDALFQKPFEAEDRLIVIRNSEKISKYDFLDKFIASRKKNPNTFVVLVSNEERAEKTKLTDEQRSDGEKPEYVPHIRKIVKHGRMIECRPFSEGRYAVTWLQSRTDINDALARHIVARANGQTRLIRDASVKLGAIPEYRNAQVVNELLAEQPSDGLDDALMALDKRSALQSLESLSEDQVGKVLYRLSRALDRAGWVHDLQAQRKTPAQIALALGERSYMLKSVMEVSKYYTPKRRIATRMILDKAISAYEDGSREGVLESVIAVW